MKWEYTVLVTSESLIKELNSFGEESWEAVNVEKLDEESWRIVFKRAK